MRRKNILMITYDFPPIGGGGIQRNLKFLKYLSRLGWRTNVLTVKERDYYVYDSTLLSELSDETVIYRADSIDPLSVSTKIRALFGKFKSNKSLKKETISVSEDAWYVGLYRTLRNWILLPDGYNGWIPFATRLGKNIVKENRPDVIFGSFPGPSNAFVTYKLAKKNRIPYVLDFRDGWTDDPYTHYPSIFHKKYHSYFERKIILGAEKIVVYADSLRKILSDRYPILNDKITVITNGFDPEDFINLVPKVRLNNKIRIVYSGAVYVDRRETYLNFIKAISSLETIYKERLEIIFVGDKLKWATDLVISEKLENIISFTGYLTHKEALEYLISADASLMFLKIGDEINLTGKIFEYIGVGLPIIACVETNGACSKLLDSINHSHGVCNPSNPIEIASKIKLFLDEGFPKLSETNIEIFSRKYHSEKLSEILNEIC
ncbi:glycosyltransferase [Lacihabitans sp. CS3-21]|uniref:glycosyltransferase n=1 Tax=Lacihabitans sp. CS3-21 TaxID=2487332 RepID=UPI0020CDBC0A|nr:glycosyltransferase [Lacihabitans sp. CS3-21]MCP9747562.1 glycosyltransferase [Lacihabitans sp. CS3-21]